MKKIYNKLTVVLALLGILMILVGSGLYYISNNNAESGDSNKKLICSRDNNSETISNNIQFIYDIVESGVISGYQMTIISTYNNEEEYNQDKKLKFENFTLTYDDSKKQIVKTHKVSSLLNEDNEEVNINYQNQKREQEDLGYQCHISE